jgi:putative tryptophan/tyrosine transport system substrate-binding protein
MLDTKRRDFIALLGGGGLLLAAKAKRARAQQPAMPVIAFIDATSAVASARWTAAFRNGLNETGYTEGRNVAVEYHWLEGRYDRLQAPPLRSACACVLRPSGTRRTCRLFG